MHTTIDKAQRIVQDHLYVDLEIALSKFDSDPEFEYHVSGVSISEIVDIYRQAEKLSCCWPRKVQAWVISDWLAYRLMVHGQPVQRVLSQNVWTRKIIHERIWNDPTIQEIASGHYDYMY